MKKLIKKLMGLDEIEAKISQSEEQLRLANERLAAAEKAAEEARLKEEESKLTAKERATRKKEPWVGVLETHVNKENVRNGFFELDWNDLFVANLITAGYGTTDDPAEEVVDRWFRELCANVVVDGDFGGPVNTGVIDIQSVKRNNNL
jgi:hypothetical protein